MEKPIKDQRESTRSEVCMVPPFLGAGGLGRTHGWGSRERETY